MPESRRLPSVLGPAGREALATLLQQSPLLAFDFDGTLAPIVERPGDAQVAPGVSLALQALNRVLPVAVISGRSRSDLLQRLGFEPAYAVGNHGAEDGRRRLVDDRPLQALRQRLQAASATLSAQGVLVEDKGWSLALHHRGAADPERAHRVVLSVLQPLPAGLRTFGGKQVSNVALFDAPDKADALHALVARCGAGAALYVGDDVNDEPAFARAPPHWVTVQVGRPPPLCSARFRVGSPQQVGQLLRVLLREQVRQQAALMPDTALRR